MLERPVDRRSWLEALVEVHGEFTALGNALGGELKFLLMVSGGLQGGVQFDLPCTPLCMGQTRQIDSDRTARASILTIPKST